ncbi:MAG: hypothetical protein M3177_01875 [Pseudomonadota bacterium]|nr:hypothetical protein [Pseudomonadota bacterium]
MAHDQRAIMAANNNADLYQAVFEAWGLRYRRRPFAFVSMDKPPPYYSHLTVLAPNCTGRVISHLRTAVDCFDGAVSFKDSFCEFELQAEGFDVLFEAAWLWRAAEAAPCPKGWSKVEDPLELAEWEAAWKGAGSPTPARIFRDAMLRSPDILFLAKKEVARFVSGCIANMSSDCVGISNLFSISGEEGAFEEAAAAVASVNPALPIVGYGAGARLDAAGRAGFHTTGRLRILAAQRAHFRLPT